MFAILINEENMPKIRERITVDSELANAMTYLRMPKIWFVVTGFVTESGKYFPYAVLPAYMLKNDFDYDPVKIQTDWDQIVRL